MEAICSSETSVDTQPTTWRYITEVDTIHNHRCENLKSYTAANCLYMRWVGNRGILKLRSDQSKQRISKYEHGIGRIVLLRFYSLSVLPTKQEVWRHFLGWMFCRHCSEGFFSMICERWIQSIDGIQKVYQKLRPQWAYKIMYFRG
jgi:hypothetical protein